jgi:hypothetical protein
MKTNKVQGLKVKAGLKAGGFRSNHNSRPIRVRSGLKAGAEIYCRNHSRFVLIGW